jgi:hypothetical protein
LFVYQKTFIKYLYKIILFIKLFLVLGKRKLGLHQ